MYPELYASKSSTEILNVVNNKNIQTALIFTADNPVNKYFLKFIVSWVSEALERYSNMAKMIPNDKSCILCNYLAKRKKKQTIELHRKYRELSSDSSLYENSRLMHCSPLTNYLIDVNFKPITTLHETYRYILGKEQKSLNTYQRFLKQEYANDIKNLNKFMIECTKQDIEGVKKKFTLLNTA